MPYEGQLPQFFGAMKHYAELAHQLYGKRVYAYITPHYLDSRNAIDPQAWRQILTAARHEWKVEGVNIFLLKSVPSDIDPNAPWRNETLDFAAELRPGSTPGSTHKKPAE